MNQNELISHVIVDDDDESYENGKGTKHDDDELDSNIIQHRKFDSLVLTQIIEKNSKLLCSVGATILEQEAIQLRKRLILYQNKEKVVESSRSCLPPHKNLSKITWKQDNSLAKIYQDIHPFQENESNEDGIGVAVGFSQNSSFIPVVKPGSRAEKSSYYSSIQSPQLPRLVSCSRTHKFTEKSKSSIGFEVHKANLDNQDNGNHFTSDSLSSNKRETYEKDDNRQLAVSSKSLDEGEYLFSRAKRLKKMAGLLNTIEMLHEHFILQVMDLFSNDECKEYEKNRS